MARPVGSKNKPEPTGDSEDDFLITMVLQQKKWKAAAIEKRNQNVDATLEESYAEAVRVLINKFTQIAEE